mgnify:CR=1 FL=1
MKKIIYRVTMKMSKKFLIEKYSQERYKAFCLRSKQIFNEILPTIPDIGKSIFSFNYKFAPSYIAWYKAFSEMGLSQEEINQNIWAMNEKMTGIVPKSLLHIVGKAYFNSFRKKAAEHIKRQNSVGIHPYDWQIKYRYIDKNCFEIDILTCPFKKLAHEYGVEGLLPGICRMDYLFASLMKNGFERTKTLGDGDDCCNCRYYLEGSCEWAPEKGFEHRK